MTPMTRRSIIAGGIALAGTPSTLCGLVASLGIGVPAAGGGRTEPQAAASGLEVVATLDQRPGGIALTPDGRLLVSRHPFPYGEPAEHRVVEVLPDGRIRPFPNERWSGATDPDGVGLDGVLGLEADRDGLVWMLDMGGAGGSPPKIVAWDTRRDELARVVYVPGFATRRNSFQQDLVIDPVRQAAYVADMTRGDLFGESDPAILAVDLRTGAVRRALAKHPSLAPEDIGVVVDGRPLRSTNADGEAAEPRLGLNPIALDPAAEWVYYGAFSGTSVYRVRAADLADPALAPVDLGERVERYGDKAPSDGIGVDGGGNVYVTDLGRGAIGVTEPGGTYRVLVQDERLSWPDGMALGPDGFFYVSVSQLHRAPAFNGGEDGSQVPFRIVRFRPLSGGKSER